MANGLLLLRPIGITMCVRTHVDIYVFAIEKFAVPISLFMHDLARDSYDLGVSATANGFFN